MAVVVVVVIVVVVVVVVVIVVVVVAVVTMNAIHIAHDHIRHPILLCFCREYLLV